MGATLANLVKVRSRLAIDIRDYYEALISTLDVTPWYREGQVIRARDIAIPAQVLKRAPKPPRDAGGDAAQRFSAQHFLVPEIARLYEEPTPADGEIVEWEEELRQVRRAVVKGAPGSGKSFLTQMTAVKLACTALAQLAARAEPLHPLLLPIHVDLAQLAQANLSLSLEEALLAVLSAPYALSPRLKDWMQEKLRSTECWLIFDALDQVEPGDRSRLRQLLQQLDTQRWQSHVILTCRSANYNSGDVPWPQITEYEIAPHAFGPMQEFVTQWFAADPTREQTLQQALSQNFALSQACRVPLVLTLTCLAHEEQEVTATTRRGDIYGWVLRGLVRRAWKPENRRNPFDPHIAKVLRDLTPTAKILFTQQPTSNLFRQSDIQKAIDKARQEKNSKLDELFPEILDCGILIGAGFRPDGEPQFSFLHRSFLEYLTARALAEQGWDTIVTEIDKKAWDPAWQEVIIFLAGQLKTPREVENLLSLLADKQRDDVFRHRLALAAQCLPEAHPTLCHDDMTEIEDRITTDAFTLWEKHCQLEKHRALPHLIAALPMLAQVNAQVQPGTSFLERVWELLIDEDQIKHRTAILTIGTLGIMAVTSEIYMDLRTRLGDGDVCEIATTAIENPDSVAPTPRILMALCLTMLTHPDRGFREAATATLRKLGGVAATSETLIALRKMRMDKAGKSREAAAEDIKKRGSVAATPESLIALHTMWTGKDWYEHRVAAEALGKLRAQGIRIFERNAGSWEMKRAQELSNKEYGGG